MWSYLEHLEHLKRDDSCHFNDLADLSGGLTADCRRHGKKCAIPQSGIDYWSCGFSCTAVSHFNQATCVCYTAFALY